MGQTVTLATKSPRLRVTALRGLSAPVTTGGYGGWQQIARPRRVALTEWAGIEPLQLSLPLLLEGFATDQSVEPAIDILERMAQPAQAGAQPPAVTVIGAVPHADRTWVIDTNGLEWDQQTVEYHPDGFRTRQAVTVKLIEFIADSRIDHLSPAERARLKAATASAIGSRGRASVGRTRTVRQGETLTSIAASDLGDYRRWTEVADINGKRDPRSVEAGEVLSLP